MAMLWRSLLVIALACSAAYAQPVTGGGGAKLRSDCATNDLLKWDGVSQTWICSGGPAVTGSGAANNIAKWTAGSVLGMSMITDTGTKTTISNGTSTAQPATAGTLVEFEQGTGTNYLSLRGTSTMGVVFANASSALDGAILYGHTLARSMAFLTANTSRGRFLNTGALMLGDTGSSTAIDNNVDNLTIGNTGTGQTASTALIDASHTGSFDTSGGAFSSIGAQISMTATRSAGANNYTNKALVLTATGGQSNLAIETNDGDNKFNRTSGMSTFSGDVSLEKHVVVEGTEPTLSSCGTSPTVIGTDTAGTITVGTGGTGCTVTFATAYATNAPSCIAMFVNGGSLVLTLTTISTTAFTVSSTTGADLAAKKINYVCAGIL